MINRNKKIFMIIAIIVLLIIIIGTICGILYAKTDFLKSNRVLFSKYMTQNIAILNELQSTTVTNVYENIKNNEKYESTTNMNIEHSKGGEISNPINNLAIKINTQKDEENRYLHTDAQLLFKNQEYLQIELIKDKEEYGIRFSDVVKQFVTIKDDENLQVVADDLGLDIETLYHFMDILDGKNVLEGKMSSEELRNLQNNYLNLLMQKMDDLGTYSKLKNSMITVENQTIKANAYMINLNKEQVKTITLEILNNIKTDETIKTFLTELNLQNSFNEMMDNTIKKVEENQEFGDLKITVYEQKGITVRTSIEYGVNNITIDSSFENGTAKVKIQNNELNSEKVNQQNIEITKTNIENQETYNVIIDMLEGEEKKTIKISNDLQSNGNAVKMNTNIAYIEDIVTTSLVIANEINVTDSIQQKIKLDETNNVVLNNLEQQNRKNVIKIVQENTEKKYEQRIELLNKELNPENQTEEQENAENNTMSQIDINRFNAKFEFYTGDEVTAENVKGLLDVVKSNVKSVEFPNIVSEGQGLTESDKETIKLYIQKDTENTELINTVMEKIEDNRKYKVEISYNGENGLIDYITITESK